MELSPERHYVKLAGLGHQTIPMPESLPSLETTVAAAAMPLDMLLLLSCCGSATPLMHPAVTTQAYMQR
jgi:hypothetical protein